MPVILVNMVVDKNNQKKEGQGGGEAPHPHKTPS
jgi:hypothetical protein